LEKNVAGTYTTVQSTAVTYSAGATLRVIKDGTKYRVYYNNALVGTEQTISDAGIISNTKHGLFSTYSGNTFDNFTLWPRGSGTTKFTDAPFEELVSTRDTTTTYNNSTASVKLVAGGTDANYVQSVNVGDTQTYNLIAYAYTDGTAVTTADLSLYYGSTTLTTTYTAMGGTGWYKLTGSLTGEASAKDYGVRVKAGKTVYVDEMHLQVGTGTNQTMYVLNSNTGVTGLNVQGLVNGTNSGVATFSKAGTISDADFGGGVTDGMMGIDTTNHRIYFREGGSWSYSAKAGGFQIPNYEAGGLSTGDYLMPYVESFMEDGQKAYLTNVTPEGFSIKLPTLAMRDFIYNWIAIATSEQNITKSQSIIQQILGSQITATPSPTLIPTETPVASASPMITPTP